MAKGILGRKLGMTQIFTAEGALIPVTVVEAGNSIVLQNRTVENDGYNAVQLGFGTVKDKKVTKPMKGHFEKAGVKPVKFIREIRLAAPSEYEKFRKAGSKKYRVTPTGRLGPEGFDTAELEILEKSQDDIASADWMF